MTIAGISALAANCLSHALQPVTQRTLEFIRYMHTPVAKWSGSLHGHEWSYIDGRPVSAAELFANLAKRNGTFDNQWLLSKLPVPGLDQSLNLFLESLEPILSKEEYQKTKEAAKVFREGRGASLHVQLLGLSYITTNWIKEMWLKCAYLMSRKPLILSSSWYGADSLRDYRKLYSPNNIQYERAARLVHLGLRRHLEIESNTYPPIILRGMMPICMDPYRYLFGTTRIPKEGMDELQTTKSNHIIVLANGHIYKVEVIEKGLLLCESSLRQQFAWILNDAKTRGQGEGISLLTGDERDRWAQNREKLIVENSKQLEAVESALMALRFSNDEPQSVPEQADTCLRNCRDLWLDITLNLTCCKNGVIGGTNEHTAIDADTPAIVIDNMYKEEVEAETVVTPDATPPLLPQHLQWKLNDELKSEIKRVDKDLKRDVQNLDFEFMQFEGYGKEFIKPFNMSPDSYIQMVFQHAYYKIHHETPLTYETAGTRKFKEARTETIRSASTESNLMCQIIENPDASNEEKRDAIRKAVAKHTERRTNASLGQGCDRHLLALRILDRNQDPFFQLEANNLPFKLATSQTPCSHSYGGGFYPICDEGYGISYFPRSDYLLFHVSSFNSCDTTSSSRLCASIKETLQEFQAIFLNE